MSPASPRRRSAPPRPKRVDVPAPTPIRRPPQRPELPVGTEADTQAPALVEEVVTDPDYPPYETRPRASRGDDVPLLGNDELARIFYEIGDMLELSRAEP